MRFYAKPRDRMYKKEIRLKKIYPLISTYLFSSEIISFASFTIINFE